MCGSSAAVVVRKGGSSKGISVVSLVGVGPIIDLELLGYGPRASSSAAATSAGSARRPAFFGQGETKEQAFALMDAAWELGLRRFDTADAYGGGRSEQWIGDWLRATGNRPRITSKTFNAMEDGADSGLARERVLRQVETSLERLGVDADRPLPDARARPGHAGRGDVATFQALLERGVIGAWGVSATSARTTSREWLALGTPALVQNSYSLLDRGDEAEVIPLCAEHGIEYQAFSPLAGGWLTGKYRRGEERAGGLADDDAARAVPPPRERRDLRRARGARARRPRSAA